MKTALKELRATNSTNEKIAILKKNINNDLLKRVLKMTYDKVAFSYGITTRNIRPDIIPTPYNDMCHALDALQFKLNTRAFTGNSALNLLECILDSLSEEDGDIIKMVIDRDLKLGLGRTNINKVFKGLIIKPPYSRCDVGTEKNIKKNIDFNGIVYSQLKADGMYKSAVCNDTITIMSRSGNEDSFPLIEKEIEKLNCSGFVLLGEFTLIGEKERSKGNGLINSDNPPHEKIIFTVWDILPLNEFRMDKKEIKTATKNGTMSKYSNRLFCLESMFEGKEFKHIQIIPYKTISSMTEAYEHFQELTKNGFEGTVIKSGDLTWKDGTSTQQLKVKLAIELEMRFTSYNEGNKGSKNEDYFSGINFENDEGTITGTVGVTSMTEKQRDWFHVNREQVIGSVFEVVCNDITKAKNKNTYALSHPRFSELRVDKTETDTLERCLELKQLAMECNL